jgi:hypothetical protein
MTVSEHFGLHKSQYELDFVDIELRKDMPLFLDPYHLGCCEFSWAIDANRTLEQFFSLLLTYLQSDQIDEARTMFSHLGEPNETHLGYSQAVPQGRGVGPIDTEKIFDSLLQSKAMQTGVAEDIEDFRLFVKGVDKDKMSDLTTNIIKKHLIAYSQNQCRLWGIPMQPDVPSGFYWDRTEQRWRNEYVEYLVVASQKLLLVPKRIVSYADDYTPEKYERHFVLNFLQYEHLQKGSHLVQVRRDKRGRITKKYVTKKSILEEIGHITKDFLVEFTKRHPKVFAKFKTETRSKVRSLSNEELTDALLTRIINYLIQQLDEVPPGNDEASRYHRLAVGILELLFYPKLTSPIVEREIHDGRKRIDITFDNAAETGFFYRLGTTYRTPSQFILVECKNYAGDPKNPELDQMSGRFAPNRGQFGLILCRSIANMELFLNRCKDTYKDMRGLVIPIVDSDLISMLMDYETKGPEVGEEIIMDRYRTIALS